ncbi:MAG: MoaD/ThiS family protein [Desulfobacterales bacterium]|nr:MAG: MoaD/ThiS family protein [Desulfobacterales bacterium]
MAVHIELSPFLRQYAPGYNPEEGLLIENGSGKTIGALIRELGIPTEKVNSIMVNYRPSDPTYVAKDGDRIGLVMSIGGG